MAIRSGLIRILAAFALVGAIGAAKADPGGRLPATGGVVNVEGSGGGGLSTWALISGYGTDTEWGGAVSYTRLPLTDYQFESAAVTLGLFDRVEFSLARQRFDLQDVVVGEVIEQDIVGLKWRLAGDAVFTPDSALPQLALGLQYKRNRDFERIPAALGGTEDSDTEPYLAATKLYFGAVFGHNLLVNAGLRYSRANQFGLLGFGGPKDDSRSLLGELALGVFLTDQLVLGAEYRQRPDNLVYAEQAARDAFLAWVPNRYLAVTLARVELGHIAVTEADQSGTYLQVQLNY
ncbi:DUF3034 family protein [Permianibacter sp. IMCC34836]|uniref:DUF3034 family protein n=1 Tax=Permianibacter fluminis TaxID=2738515 RepID=UPI0015519B4F|nr:DUF3034 family protein [Permianibacter fluminis]NQD36504.1 DUF3034 family protein [Permianibacter fluminis]